MGDGLPQSRGDPEKEITKVSAKQGSSPLWPYSSLQADRAAAAAEFWVTSAESAPLQGFTV